MVFGFYLEGLFWYLLLIDCIIYNVMTWLAKYYPKFDGHWISEWIPLNRFMALWYFLLTAWIGFLLFRMQLLGMYN